jgi:hypothetical protein
MTMLHNSFSLEVAAEAAMEWKHLRTLLLRGRAITARDRVELKRADLIEGDQNVGRDFTRPAARPAWGRP